MKCLSKIPRMPQRGSLGMDIIPSPKRDLLSMSSVSGGRPSTEAEEWGRKSRLPGSRCPGKSEHCCFAPFRDHGQKCRYSFLLSIFLNPVPQAASASCLAVKWLALCLLLLSYLKVHLVKTDFLEKNSLIKELLGWKMLKDIKSVVICFRWNDSLTFRDTNWD